MDDLIEEVRIILLQQIKDTDDDLMLRQVAIRNYNTFMKTYFDFIEAAREARRGEAQELSDEVKVQEFQG